MMPRKFNLPLTYAPKIEGVRNGTIRQTIRTGRRFAVGDHVSGPFSPHSQRLADEARAEHAAQLARLSQRIRDEEAAERHADEIKGVQG